MGKWKTKAPDCLRRPYVEANGQLNAPTTLILRRTTDTHFVGDFMEHTASVDFPEKEKISYVFGLGI
jgi:hypothetical protein